MIKEPILKEPQKEPDIEFKTLITKSDYDRILKENSDVKGDLQTNYYFDTPRFTLKASETDLRVKETDKKLVLILERKKNYNHIRLEQELTKDEFKELLETREIKFPDIANEISDLVKNLPIENYMSFSTYRVNIPFKNIKFSLDKCDYCDITDYEIEYRTKNKESGKLIFVDIIKTYNLEYYRSQSKIKRAYEALKNYL